MDIGWGHSDLEELGQGMKGSIGDAVVVVAVVVIVLLGVVVAAVLVVVLEERRKLAEVEVEAEETGRRPCRTSAKLALQPTMITTCPSVKWEYWRGCGLWVAMEAGNGG